jgi:phosphomannomutase
MDDYVGRLLAGYAGGAYRIGWDAGNGAAGPVIEKLVKLLPGEHHLLYTDVDANFPNHHPDPTEEKNLEDLKALVAEKGLDFGVAFDGDGDRIGAVDGKGPGRLGRSAARHPRRAGAEGQSGRDHIGGRQDQPGAVRPNHRTRRASR